MHQVRHSTARARSMAVLLLGILAALSLPGRGTFGQRANIATTQPGAAARRALLIGINEYRSPDIPKLSGAVNDVEAVRQVLTTKFGFRQDDIRTLTDRDASRRAILAEFDRLVVTAGPHDVVYIHYSGHGSQMPRVGGDTTGRVDGAIVPYDGRTEKVADITGDEIDAYLARLRSSHVILVLDACHDGPATHARAIRTRCVPPDHRVDLYRAGATTVARAPDAADRRYLRLSASAPDQPALDGLIDGQQRGLFSHALVTALSSLPADADVTSVMRHIESEIDRFKAQLGAIDMPSPQLEAEKDRLGAALFPRVGDQPGGAERTAGGTDATRVPWVEAEAAEPGKVRLRNGTSLGAGEGSLWWIYPPGEKEFVRGEAAVSARVVEVQGSDNVAAPEPAGSAVPPGSRAIVAAAAPASSDLPVHFRAASQPGAVEMQARLQQQLPQLRLVGADAFARFIVSFDAGRCRVFDATGLQAIDDFAAADAGSAVERLRQIFSRSIASAELLSTVNPSTDIGLAVRIVGTADGAQEMRADSTRRVRLAANGRSPRFHIRSEGQSRSADNSLQLAITAAQDVFVTVVDVDQEGGVNLLFPVNYQKPDFYPEGRVAAGQTAVMPDSFAPSNRSGFHWDMAAPAGLDTIRVFATTHLETAVTIRRYLEELGAPDQSQPRGGKRPASLGDLNRSLSALAGTRSFGGRRFPDWSAASVTLFVTR